MRKPILLTLVLLLLGAGLVGAGPAQARGTAADDCPAGSTDPDCADTAKPANGK